MATKLRLLFIITALRTAFSSGSTHRISDADGLIEFSRSVNGGTSYSGTTVLLDADIDFTEALSKEFYVIGNDTNFFKGTFDGQGHMVSNLTIKTTILNSGLFGYSTGTTVKNLVISGSYSVFGNYVEENDQVLVGGVIGNCEAKERECKIESNINMVDITIAGNIYAYFIGGVVGWLVSFDYGVIAKNCVNYGTLGSNVTSTYMFMGGVMGSPQRDTSSNKPTSVHNCLNYGTLTYNGTSDKVRIGGVVGFSIYGWVDNCVSLGRIFYTERGDEYVGGVVGYADSSEITHCYWDIRTSDRTFGFDYIAVATGNYHFNESFELSENASIGNYTGTSLIGALNAAADYYSLRDYSHWALNRDSNDLSFVFDSSNTSFASSSQVVLFPKFPSKNNLEFDGWYVDATCTEKLANYELSGEEELYGKWKENNNFYTITFDTNGGTSVRSKTAQFGSILELTKGVYKNEHSFLWWENEYGDSVPFDFPIPPRNITLRVAWISNHIRSVDDFLDFSRKVYYGTSYYGTTVYLDSDIDFIETQSEEFGLMGQDKYNYFRGTFDGRGYVINNLAINSSIQYVGLFGYTTDITIKNVIIGEGCSVTGNFVSTGDDHAFTGGVIGCCETDNGQCSIEGSVNMAKVTSNENVVGASFIGGIAGALVSTKNPITAKNCVNYGTVLDSGTNGFAFIGGVVGSPQRDSVLSIGVYVQNCINYGSLIQSGTTSKLRAGGISGLVVYGNFENCLSAGAITVKGHEYVGSIVGYVEASSLSHCYWTNDVRYNSPAGFSETTLEDNTYQISQINTTTRDKLNEYSEAKGFAKWLMLDLNGGKVNGISQGSLVAILKRFGSPAKEGSNFLFWCKDFECTEEYVPKGLGIIETDDLYAGWETVTVTFNPMNGDETTQGTVKYGEKYGILLETPVRTGHSFAGWFTDESKGTQITSESAAFIAKDHSLYGHWAVNSYTAVFDFENGVISVNEFVYNSTIEYPSVDDKDKCTFNGWSPRNITLMPGNNVTFVPIWDCDSKLSPGAIVAVAIVCIIIIALLSLIVVFSCLIKKRRYETGYINVEMASKGPSRGKRFSFFDRKTRGTRTKRGNWGYDDEIEFVADSARSYIGLYPEDYEVPTLPDALWNAGLDSEKVSIVMNACKRVGDCLEDGGSTPVEFTYDNALAIAMYTYSFGDREYEENPYRLINMALVDDDRSTLQDVSGLLYHVMTSLRKLPRVTGKTLYRGIRERVNKRDYASGSIVVWHGLSSTSLDINTVKASLGRAELSGGNESKKARGTLFIIENAWGYDIQPYSLFPDEEEILLEPEREFKVQSVIESGATIVKLRMLDTPLVLPEVFGEGQHN